MFTNSTLSALFACLWALSFLTHSSESAQESKQIVSGTWFEIDSKVMLETRRYAVHVPPSYHEKTDRRYPVLYVLDGSTTKVRGVGGMIESLSYFDLGQQIPEFIVVAIPNTNRSRDLTPTKNDLKFKGQILDKIADNSGGADRYAKFMRNELFPKIEAEYRTTKQRGILGMSFGGLFAAHILLKHSDMFSQYLISDATFVWDDNYLNHTLAKSKQNLVNKKLGVFVGLANNDHLGELGITNRQWGNDFIAGLQSINSTDLTVSSRYFPEEQHGTVMFLAFYYGLIDLFKISQCDNANGQNEC